MCEYGMAPELHAGRGIAPLGLEDIGLGSPIRARLNLSTRTMAKPRGMR